MSEELQKALDKLLDGELKESAYALLQRRAILNDMLWKAVRKDWHGVADCAMDLRELHL